MFVQPYSRTVIVTPVSSVICLLVSLETWGLKCHPTGHLTNLQKKETIFITMTSLLNFVPIVLKGETLDAEVIKACCDSFAKYIYEELT